MRTGYTAASAGGGVWGWGVGVGCGDGGLPRLGQFTSTLMHRASVLYCYYLLAIFRSENPIFGQESRRVFPLMKRSGGGRGRRVEGGGGGEKETRTRLSISVSSNQWSSPAIFFPFLLSLRFSILSFRNPIILNFNRISWSEEKAGAHGY